MMAEAIATDASTATVHRNCLRKTYIVSRHIGAIKWLNEKGYFGCIILQWEPKYTTLLNCGDIVVGTLPLPMVHDIIQRGATFIHLSLPTIAFGERGNELTPDEMDDAGATLYKIYNITMEVM